MNKQTAFRRKYEQAQKRYILQELKENQEARKAVANKAQNQKSNMPYFKANKEITEAEKDMIYSSIK